MPTTATTEEQLQKVFLLAQRFIKILTRISRNQILLRGLVSLSFSVQCPLMLLSLLLVLLALLCLSRRKVSRVSAVPPVSGLE